MDVKDAPRLALTLGDPAGIGPEIVFQAMERPEWADLRWVLIGPEALRPEGYADFAVDAPGGRSWLSVEGPSEWRMGEVQESCGQAALAALRAGADLATARQVDGLLTAPVNKAALHLAGEKVEGQTELLARWAGVSDYEMLVVVDRLHVLLLTRHMPLRQAIESIDTDRVVHHLTMLHAALQGLGIQEPRLALAGLNPHAGEGGVLGREDGEILEPAVRRVRESGVQVEGPISPDSVFAMGRDGAFDGILALYHDQAFIPLKLMSEDRGVTAIVGLPYLRVSPVHGTAFDIAGKGEASEENLVQAGLRAAAWARARRT